MTIFQLIGLMTTLIALFGYINHRFIRLPDTLGITAVGFVLATGLVLLGHHEPKVVHWAQNIVSAIDFTEVVFHGMLPLLLFAGSLHVRLADIAEQKGSILALSTLGVIISTAVVGTVLHYGLAFAGITIPVGYCLLFGALISPTDPIAVQGILKKVGVPKSLETKISGESLFNDGTAVVAFLLLLGITQGQLEPSVSTVGTLLLNEVLGALVVGLCAGFGGVLLLRDVDSYPVEILITLALAMGGYGVAEAVHASAPLTVVVIGLIIGNVAVKRAMSEKTKTHLFNFWELIDELLTLVLFGLIGIEVLALDMGLAHLQVGLMAIPVVLLARWVSVAIPMLGLKLFREFSPHSVAILTWGGLRGGISIALALSLPAFAGRDLLIAATYIVVLFSLLVQATTLERLLNKLTRPAPNEQV